jgi:hypothetical protein
LRATSREDAQTDEEAQVELDNGAALKNGVGARSASSIVHVIKSSPDATRAVLTEFMAQVGDVTQM